MPNKLIYLVEDNRDIQKLASRSLKQYGYAVECFHNGTSARNAIRRCQPDLVICDLGLPDMDGITLVRELWENPGIGVIILTGRSSLTDRVFGLEVGADDYITKPFEPRELVARTASLLRRMEASTKRSEIAGKKASFAGWTFDPDTLRLTSDEGSVESLSSAESHLLLAFLHSPNRVLSREQLLECSARRADQDQAFDRSIDVRVSRLRQKLQSGPKKHKLINTVYGAGYLFSVQVEWI